MKNKVMTTTAKIVLDKINKAIDFDNEILGIAAVVKAKQELEAGGTSRAALYRIRTDLDKLCEPSENFKHWCQTASDCLLSADAIEVQNALTNQGKGSSVARALCLCLERLDLKGARTVYGVDGDKVRQYPDLNRVISQTIVGCRAHSSPYYCRMCSNT